MFVSRLKAKVGPHPSLQRCRTQCDVFIVDAIILRQEMCVFPFIIKVQGKIGSRQNDCLLPKPMLFHQPMVSQSCLLDDPYPTNCQAKTRSPTDLTNALLFPEQFQYDVYGMQIFLRLDWWEERKMLLQLDGMLYKTSSMLYFEYNNNNTNYLCKLTTVEQMILCIYWRQRQTKVFLVRWLDSQDVVVCLFRHQLSHRQRF